MKKDIISVSDSAIKRISEIMQSQQKSDCKGLRISVKAAGCSGLGYKFDIVDQVNDADEMVQAGDFQLYIDKAAVLYIIGSDLQYMSGEMRSGFVFKNPNAKETCGCGESFAV